jgi:3-dehydroquinate synthase
MPVVNVRLPAKRDSYQIQIGVGLLSNLGREVRTVLGHDARRAALISNKTVFQLYGKQAKQSLNSKDFHTTHWLMAEGERHKSLKSLAQALEFLATSGFERGDVVVALGGGVVGDLAGFAAASYLRGVAFIQVPTTLLAQIDASVGGKTAVNLPAGKNLVGAFHQPRLVLIDTKTLETLPKRELTSGWCEAVKQGAVGSPRLFEQTRSLLSKIDSHDIEKFCTEVGDTIAAHCRFKASIVMADEREDASRTDAKSRRVLNFGHTTAHALETLTGYRQLRHGEAVGYGMLVAGEISKSLGMLGSGELESLREAVRLCGRLPPVGEIDFHQIKSAMTADKKSVAGRIKWVLLDGIGRACIVDGKDINDRVLKAALRAGLQSI